MVPEGAQQFPFGKGHFYEENSSLYLNFAKSTASKAQGTTAIAVGAMGYFEGGIAALQNNFFNSSVVTAKVANSDTAFESDKMICLICLSSNNFTL